MPEQITKHPEVTLKVLKGAGARCGEGVEPKILTKCPAERFCSLPSGEICVYGIADVPKMTQITTKDLAAVVCPRPAEAGFMPLGIESLLLAGAILLFGVVLRKAKAKSTAETQRRGGSAEKGHLTTD